MVKMSKSKLVSEEGIQEAEFFLNELRSSQPGQSEFIYFLKAFLTSCVSILDYLLEDANRIFSLNISEKEPIRDNFFLKKAESNYEANEFYKWWFKKRKSWKVVK